MKEIEVYPGAKIRASFFKAWQLFWKLKAEELVCFHFNDCRVIIMPDSSNCKTEILTSEKARLVVEGKI